MSRLGLPVAALVTTLALSFLRPPSADAAVYDCRNLYTQNNFLEACSSVYTDFYNWGGNSYTIAWTYPVSQVQVFSHRGWEKCDGVWYQRWGPYAQTTYNATSAVVSGGAYIMDCSWEHYYSAEGGHIVYNSSPLISWYAWTDVIA